MDENARHPSFGLAVVAVLAAGFATSYAATLFIGFTPYLGRSAWTIATSLLGAVLVRFVLRALGYEISFLAAVLALVAGAVVSIAFIRLLPPTPHALVPHLPTAGLVTGIPSLLLSAWLIQISSSRAGGQPLS